MKFSFLKSYEQFLCIEVEADSLAEAERLSDEADETDWETCDEGGFVHYPPRILDTRGKWVGLCVCCGTQHTNDFSLTCPDCNSQRESGDLDLPERYQD